MCIPNLTLLSQEFKRTRPSALVQQIQRMRLTLRSATLLRNQKTHKKNALWPNAHDPTFIHGSWSFKDVMSHADKVLDYSVI